MTTKKPSGAERRRRARELVEATRRDDAAIRGLRNKHTKAMRAAIARAKRDPESTVLAAQAIFLGILDEVAADELLPSASRWTLLGQGAQRLASLHEEAAAAARSAVFPSITRMLGGGVGQHDPDVEDDE